MPSTVRLLSKAIPAALLLLLLATAPASASDKCFMNWHCVTSPGKDVLVVCAGHQHWSAMTSKSQ